MSGGLGGGSVHHDTNISSSLHLLADNPSAGSSQDEESQEDSNSKKDFYSRWIGANSIGGGGIGGGSGANKL